MTTLINSRVRGAVSVYNDYATAPGYASVSVSVSGWWRYIIINVKHRTKRVARHAKFFEHTHDAHVTNPDKIWKSRASTTKTVDRAPRVRIHVRRVVNNLAICAKSKN